MELKNLEVYKLAREASKAAWIIYRSLSWEIKKIVGNQFIEAVDSVGANIAEGCGRFHFLDKNKFNYNARGSLLESIHWLELLFERELTSADQYSDLHNKLNTLHFKLNGYIRVTREQTKK